MMAQIVAETMESAGYGTLGTDLFIGRLPRTPDVATVVVDGGGSALSATHTSDAEIMTHEVLLLRRDSSYATACAALGSAVASLYPLQNTTVHGYFIEVIGQASTPHVVRTDEEGRDIYQVNVRIAALRL